jgi:hypothetical protein
LKSGRWSLVKWKLKRCIKHSVRNTKIYKIVNLENGKFKEKGKTEKCSDFGAVWYKLSDVRKAFNMICPDNRQFYKIVELEVKVKNIEEK